MKFPKLRCPVCGMVVFLRNVQRGKMHNIDTFVVDFGGRGHCVYSKDVADMKILDFWIQRLEEVLDWLDILKGEVRIRIASSPSLRVLDASVTSASIQTQERLRLSSTVDHVRLMSSKPLLRT